MQLGDYQMKYEQILDYVLANPTRSIILQSDAPPTKARAALYNGLRRAYDAKRSVLTDDILANDITLNSETEISFNIKATQTVTGSELELKLATAPARLTFSILGVKDEFANP